MRYIGGKSLLTDEIIKIIKKYTKNASSVIDVFAGSGAVSMAFKREKYKVYCNDFLFFSYVLNRGGIDLDNKPLFDGLNIKDPIKYLNGLTLEDTIYNLKDCFIYCNYSPNENCKRMYFQNKNAIKIDIIRRQIEDWKPVLTEDEYYYLLSALISAVPYVSNIAGVYGAYLKHWDARTFNDLELKEPELVLSDKECVSMNLDYVEALSQTKADVLYADPPYNARQYLPNYHLLETIARYDSPEIKGITGLRNYDNQKSEFCMKNKVAQAFEKMIQNANVRYVAISYNNEGLLSTEELTLICKKYARKKTFKLIEMDYRRYKSKIANNKSGLKEQVYFFEKEMDDEKK
ncbi:MAG: DNA adenine methylase [Eubacteriales bacterium]|nr:DNA adenine methylase [Eubacteriales bacterium]